MWYNSKQQIVWDKDYFNRHLSRKGGKLDIPSNLLGIDTIPAIFGVASRGRQQLQPATKKVQFKLAPEESNASSKKKKRSTSSIDMHYRRRSRSRTKFSKKRIMDSRESSLLKQMNDSYSSEEEPEISSPPTEQATHHPFCIRYIDKVWVIFSSSSKPIFCLPPSMCPTSPSASGSTADSDEDVFTTWAKQFDEVKFYTLQREGKPISVQFWGTKKREESCGNAEADNWLKLVSNLQD